MTSLSLSAYPSARASSAAGLASGPPRAASRSEGESRRLDRVAGGAAVPRMPNARVSRDACVDVAWLHGRERDDVAGVEHGEERGHSEVVRELGEHWGGGGVEVRCDAVGECCDARAEPDEPGVVADREPVVFERAEESVGVGPVHAKLLGEAGDRDGGSRLCQYLQRAQAACERLGSRGLGRRAGGRVGGQERSSVVVGRCCAMRRTPIHWCAVFEFSVQISNTRLSGTMK